MIRRYKTLILFLVLATMSLRGLAAVDMWHCADYQGYGLIAAAASHAEHHDLNGGGAADHPGHDSSISVDPEDDSSSSLGAHCISSVVAPVERISFSFAPAGASRIPFIALRFVGVVPAQPDRPPLVQSL